MNYYYIITFLQLILFITALLLLDISHQYIYIYIIWKKNKNNPSLKHASKRLHKSGLSCSWDWLPHLTREILQFKPYHLSFLNHILQCASWTQFCGRSAVERLLNLTNKHGGEKGNGTEGTISQNLLIKSLWYLAKFLLLPYFKY